MSQPVSRGFSSPSRKFRRYVTAALAAVVLIGCNSQGTSDPAATASNTTQPQEEKPAPADRLHPTVRIETSAGEIVVKLDAERAPSTVQNFLDYLNEGYYTETLFHFVEPGKMILGGGYSSDGEVKPATRFSIRNEAHNGLKNKRGTIAMTRSPDAIDSATTQFFINLADSPEFDHVEGVEESYGYCVFGKVLEGLDVADQISQTPTQNRGGELVQMPRTPVVIKSIEVVM